MLSLYKKIDYGMFKCIKDIINIGKSVTLSLTINQRYASQSCFLFLDNSRVTVKVL